MASVIILPLPPSPRDDAANLYQAFKGFGCDTGAVISILAHRNARQRAAIQKEYHTLHSEDLEKGLSSELSGNLKKAVLLWMPGPATREANIVRQALDGDIDLKAANGIICSRTPALLRQFKQFYFTNLSLSLEDNIASKASGDHKELLLVFVCQVRYEGPEFNQFEVEKDAEALYKAGGKRFEGADEKTFIDVFYGRSRAHLAAVSSTYQKKYGLTLERAVRKKTSGNFGHALTTISLSVEHPSVFFANVLCKSMKGLGTDDPTFIRVVVSRAENDMQYIKTEYKQQYGKALYDAVRSDTLGHYRAFLLALLGSNA